MSTLISGHLRPGSMRESDSDIVSKGWFVEDHIRLSFVTLSSRFTRSRERLFGILLHLQDAETPEDHLWSASAGALLRRLIPRSDSYVKRVSRNHTGVDGTRSASTESASGVHVSELNSCIIQRTSSQMDSTVTFDPGA